MITKQIQVKFNLPIELKKIVDKEAKKYGMTLASFFRHILVDRIEKEEKCKTYYASERTEKLAQEAMENYDKSIKVKNLKDFFDKL
jgi:predicted DNA-binding protein